MFYFTESDVQELLPINEAIRLMRLTFEAFNLTNRANYSAILTTPYSFNTGTRMFTPVTSYLTRTTTFDPRILQLAAKFTF